MFVLARKEETPRLEFAAEMVRVGVLESPEVV